MTQCHGEEALMAWAPQFQAGSGINLSRNPGELHSACISSQACCSCTKRESDSGSRLTRYFISSGCPFTGPEEVTISFTCHSEGNVFTLLIIQGAQALGHLVLCKESYRCRYSNKYSFQECTRHQCF